MKIVIITKSNPGMSGVQTESYNEFYGLKNKKPEGES